MHQRVSFLAPPLPLPLPLTDQHMRLILILIAHRPARADPPRQRPSTSSSTIPTLPAPFLRILPPLLLLEHSLAIPRLALKGVGILLRLGGGCNGCRDLGRASTGFALKGRCAIPRLGFVVVLAFMSSRAVAGFLGVWLVVGSVVIVVFSSGSLVAAVAIFAIAVAVSLSVVAAARSTTSVVLTVAAAPALGFGRDISG
jgi:hypothetical protein